MFWDIKIFDNIWKESFLCLWTHSWVDPLSILRSKNQKEMYLRKALPHQIWWVFLPTAFDPPRGTKRLNFPDSNFYIQFFLSEFQFEIYIKYISELNSNVQSTKRGKWVQFQIRSLISGLNSNWQITPTCFDSSLKYKLNSTFALNFFLFDTSL